MTALMCAAEGGSAECLAALIQAGSDIDAKDPAGATPAMFAAQMCNEGCVGLLVEAWADVETKDKGRTAADSAIRRKRPDVARMVESIRNAERQRQDLISRMPEVGSRMGLIRI